LISLSKNKTLVSKRKRIYKRDDDNELVLDEHGNPILDYIVTH
jgi:hypothetical protein